MAYAEEPDASGAAKHRVTIRHLSGRILQRVPVCHSPVAFLVRISPPALPFAPAERMCMLVHCPVADSRPLASREWLLCGLRRLHSGAASISFGQLQQSASLQGVH